MAGPVVVLAGGTGGAKLARGLLDVCGDDLVVIANTGDDVRIHGAHVSPDPDLTLFWLADRIDSRGWGLDGDTFVVMDHLRALGEDVWFNLGDEDLAIGIQRLKELDAGERLTTTIDALRARLAVPARVLPMCDEPVATFVQARGAWHPFQEFMIRERAEGPVDGVEFRGASDAGLTPEIACVLRYARAIIIGPSNPVISIGPILAVPGLRAAIKSSKAPAVAVSPFVGGEVLKGPTRAFMEHAGASLDAAGVAAYYGDLIDGIVADESAAPVPLLTTPTLLSTPDERRTVAEAVLRFCESLA